MKGEANQLLNKLPGKGGQLQQAGPPYFVLLSNQQSSGTTSAKYSLPHFYKAGCALMSPLDCIQLLRSIFDSLFYLNYNGASQSGTAALMVNQRKICLQR